MNASIGRKYVRVIIIAFISIFICAVPLSNQKVMAREIVRNIDLALLWRVRFEVLGQSPKGLNYIHLFDTYGKEITQILIDHPSMAVESISVLKTWQSNLDAFVNGYGDDVIITDKQIQLVSTYLDHLTQWVSPDLKFVIDMERSITPLETTAGMTMNQAWVYLNQDVRFPQSSGASYIVPVLSPEPVSSNLAHWTLPEYPLYSIDFEQDVWEFSLWNNGVAVSWELVNHSLSDCVVTIPKSLSDPYSEFDIENKALGDFQYESRASGYSDLIFYVVYKPLDISIMAPDSDFEQKELLFIVFPGYVDGITCINQSEALLGGLHLSTDPHN